MVNVIRILATINSDASYVDSDIIWTNYNEMILEASISNLDELYDNMIKNYELGYFVEGQCEWNGDDALMSPRSFAHTFKKRAEEMGFKFEEYKKYADEIEEWCELHLGHLESKFR